MNIDINDENGKSKKYEICLDKMGNLFLKNNFYYELCIDNKNDITFEKININDDFSYDVDFKKIDADKKLLKQKIIDKSNEEANNSDEEDNNNVIKEYLKLYPEDSDYIECEEDKYDSEDEEINVFNFYYSNSDLRPTIINCYDIPAIYDIYLYNKSKLAVKTRCIESDSSYRVSVHDNGFVALNIIGTRTKYYALIVKENNIVAQQI